MQSVHGEPEFTDRQQPCAQGRVHGTLRAGCTQLFSGCVTHAWVVLMRHTAPGPVAGIVTLLRAQIQNENEDSLILLPGFYISSRIV